jgi:hypothetical protein
MACVIRFAPAAFVAALTDEAIPQSCGRRCFPAAYCSTSALAALFQLTHYRLNHLLGLVYLEIARVDVGGEDADIALRQIFKQLRRVLQVGETEEWRYRPARGGLMPISISCSARSISLWQSRDRRWYRSRQCEQGSCRPACRTAGLTSRPRACSAPKLRELECWAPEQARAALSARPGSAPRMGPPRPAALPWAPHRLVHRVSRCDRCGGQGRRYRR